MTNGKVAIIFRCIFLIIAVFFVSGCTQAQFDPSIPVGLLSKSRDYLFFCLSIIDSSEPLYNQVAGRYYYAMFSIAKIPSIWKHKHFKGELETHEEVWRIVSKEPRASFGKELKSLRTACDYMPDCNNSSSDSVKTQLLPIIENNDAFESLVEDTKGCLKKYYRKIEPCDDNSETSCNELLNEISKCREMIIDHISEANNSLDKDC